MDHEITALSEMNPNVVHQAVTVLKRLRPAYGPILEYYGQVFIEQESVRKIAPSMTPGIPETVLAVKAREGFPLVAPSDFKLDPESFGNLLIRLCRIAGDAGLKTSESARRMIPALADRHVDPGVLMGAVLRGDPAAFQDQAAPLGLDAALLEVLARQSVRPFVAACAAGLATYVEKQDRLDTGYCPICGGSPMLALLQAEGKRYASCHFCGHPWQIKRIFCPACRNEDGDTLQYLFSDSEPEYRVDLCDRCNSYLKCVDRRKTDRPIYPPLEAVATLHLDFKAQEAGYLCAAFFH